MTTPQVHPRSPVDLDDISPPRLVGAAASVASAVPCAASALGSGESGERTAASAVSVVSTPPAFDVPAPVAPKPQEPMWWIVWKIFSLGIPLNVSQLAQLSVILVMLSFVGQFGSTALGAAGVSIGLMNATAYAFGAGLSGALETLLAHSYGRNPNCKKYGTHAQRMILLQLLVAVPLGFVVANAPTVLLRAGQPPEVVAYVSQFTQVSIWALVPFMLLEVTRRYFAAQHLSTPLTVAIVVAAALNVPLQSIFTRWFGFVGSPLVWTMLLVGMNVGLVLYLFFSGRWAQTWGGWNRDALTHWRPMIGLAVPSLGMTICEWTTLEIQTVCAGFAPPQDLATFAIAVQTVIAMWTVPSGVYIAMSVLTGNKIGERQPLEARRYATCGIIVVFCIALLDDAMVLALGTLIPRLFTSDEVVVAKFMTMRWWCLLFHLGDSFQSNMLGVMRGLGMQRRGALTVGLSFGVVGVPLSLLLFFSGAMDITALWLGPIVGVYGAGIPMCIWTLRRGVDWENLQPHGEDVPLETLIEEAEEDAVVPVGAVAHVAPLNGGVSKA